MGLFRKKQNNTEMHDLYLQQYKDFINKLNESPHAVVKNLCIQQCRNIKYIWTTKYHFDVAELNAYDPIGIKI